MQASLTQARCPTAQRVQLQRQAPRRAAALRPMRLLARAQAAQVRGAGSALAGSLREPALPGSGGNSGC